MSKKAKYCGDCKHFRIVGRDDDCTHHCLFGHRIKFYDPWASVDGTGGWERMDCRCDDFEPREECER